MAQGSVAQNVSPSVVFDMYWGFKISVIFL